MSLSRTYKNTCREGTTNPQSSGFKEGLWAYFPLCRHAFQHWKAYALCRWSDGAMLSCHLFMDGWLLPKHSLPLNQAAPLPCMRSTKIIVWGRNSLSRQLRDYQLYFQKMILATEENETERPEARQSLEDRAVGTTEGVFWNVKCISTMTIIVHHIFHTVSLGMLKDSMDWKMSFLKQHFRIEKFNQRWAMMLQYPGFAQFNKPYGQVTHWRGNETKELRCMIVPVFVATLLHPLASQRIPFTEALLCIKNLVKFHLMRKYQYQTEATIKYMENYLEEFHRHKDVVSRFRTNKST